MCVEEEKREREKDEKRKGKGSRKWGSCKTSFFICAVVVVCFFLSIEKTISGVSK